jgi:hypothetical protein
VWKDSRALFSLRIDWSGDVPAEEKSRKKKQAVEVSRRLGTIVGPVGGTYINEANPYASSHSNLWGQSDIFTLATNLIGKTSFGVRSMAVFYPSRSESIPRICSFATDVSALMFYWSHDWILCLCPSVLAPYFSRFSIVCWSCFSQERRILGTKNEVPL